MEKNNTTDNIITRAIDFYSWTLTFSGEIFNFEQNIFTRFEKKKKISIEPQYNMITVNDEMGS